MKQRVSIHLITEQQDTGAPELFEQVTRDFDEVDFGNSFDTEETQETETFEIFAQGIAEQDGTRFSVSYEETELTGMEGSTTTLSFDRDNPWQITMLRTGTVSTALTFTMGRRHITTYDTGVMPFSLCVYTVSMDNRLSLDGGRLELDYLVEIRGAHAERNHLVLEISPVEDSE